MYEYTYILAGVNSGFRRPVGGSILTATPGEAYRATPKAMAAGSRAGGHFNIGAAHARQRVLAVVDEHEVTVVALVTGEVLSTDLIGPDRRCWRNQRRDPGRWPGSPATG